MWSTIADKSRRSGLGSWQWLLAAALLPLPAILVRSALVPVSLPVATALYGLSILGAAFLLTWAAEAAERDVSGSAALAALALVAILPEYAVDLSFAWTAGHQPEYAAYAAANMTGANRLLIGLGWPLVVLVFWLRTRLTLLVLSKKHRLELGFLAAATLYAFSIPLRGSLSPLDSLVLIALFLAYLWLAARGPAEEVELVGPAERIGSLPRRRRRLLIAGIFLYSAVIILLSAEAFAAGLVQTGERLGIDRFLLVQWVAPLASEAPELIAATLLCLRGHAGSGLAVLLASAVNQWTLLLGGLPVAYSIARGEPASLPLDARQVQELALTAAQSLLAVALLARLSVSVGDSLLILACFLASLVVQSPQLRPALIAIEIVLAIAIFAIRFARRRARAPSPSERT